MSFPTLPLLLTIAGDVKIWSWAPEPGVVFLVFGLAWFYYRRRRGNPEKGIPPISSKQQWRFGLGLATIVIALISPIGVLADDYSLAVHMLQHFLLTLVAPVFLLLGLPAWMVDSLKPMLGGVPWRVWRFLTMPLLAFVIFQLPFSVYHVPYVYDLVLGNFMLHIIAHIAMLVLATISWWPVLAPTPEQGRMPALVSMLYLFLSTVPGQITGALIVFSDTILYRKYEIAGGVLGMTPHVDQQVGGLIMWVGVATFYLWSCSLTFFRWAEKEDKREISGWATKSS